MVRLVERTEWMKLLYWHMRKNSINVTWLKLFVQFVECTVGASTCKAGESPKMWVSYNLSVILYNSRNEAPVVLLLWCLEQRNVPSPMFCFGSNWFLNYVGSLDLIYHSITCTYPATIWYPSSCDIVDNKSPIWLGATIDAFLTQKCWLCNNRLFLLDETCCV